MNRRQFLQTTACTLAAGAALPHTTFGAPVAQTPSAAKLPRWRGFNLLEKFTKQKGGNSPFKESDFQIMQEWGFNFACLPMSSPHRSEHPRLRPQPD